MAFVKIINDPVYGFITIDDRLIYRIISHPYYQRLRRIKQLALAHLVYPGAVHTRLHHSLGAYHLMCNALAELKLKGVEISQDEERGAKIAILLHDIGHGPFSHALEKVLVKDVQHEELSLRMMNKLNQVFDGGLDTAIAIFKNSYPKKFLHQLVSGQLDVDRMDYLTRDSFFTGVSEGVIGYDRIIKMLTVFEGELMVEEKAVYSIEKFLVARRLMYWQVYLHKTVLSTELTLIKVLERAKELGEDLNPGGEPSILQRFLKADVEFSGDEDLELFCRLDDTDIVYAMKGWLDHPDRVLATLCRALINRELLKVKFIAEAPNEALIREKMAIVRNRLNLGEHDASYFVFTGEAVNHTYDPSDEKIRILFRDGTVLDISEVDNALIQLNLSRPMKKFYICFMK